MASTRARFCRMVKILGGTTATAKKLRCSGSMISLIKSGDRDPGLTLATRIEKMSRACLASPILATAWT